MYTPKDKKGVPQVTSGKYLPSVLNDTPFYKDNITDNSKKINIPDENNYNRFIDTDYFKWKRDYQSQWSYSDHNVDRDIKW